MRHLIFRALLPDELFDELLNAAAQRKCSPAQVAAEAIDVLLASQRLSRLPRRLGDTRERSYVECEDRGPVDDHCRLPADIPTTHDLDALADIT